METPSTKLKPKKRKQSTLAKQVKELGVSQKVIRLVAENMGFEHLGEHYSIQIRRHLARVDKKPERIRFPINVVAKAAQRIVQIFPFFVKTASLPDNEYDAFKIQGFLRPDEATQLIDRASKAEDALKTYKAEVVQSLFAVEGLLAQFSEQKDPRTAVLYKKAEELRRFHSQQMDKD
jgi:hypothetical protein